MLEDDLRVLLLVVEEDRQVDTLIRWILYILICEAPPFNFLAMSSFRMSSVSAFTRNSRECSSMPSTNEATSAILNFSILMSPWKT